MKPPTRCPLWRHPEETLANPLKRQFALHATLVEESREWRCLLPCRGWGQRSVYEFHDEVDWADGDDPHGVTVVPVETRAEIDAVCAASRVQPGGDAPRLCKDWPKGAARPLPRWVT